MRLIDADALFLPDENSDKVLVVGGQRSGGKTIALAMALLRKKMEAAPTIEAEPVKHGRWEYLQDDEWRCSNCHAIVNTGGQWAPMTDEFCRNCGAKMDGGTEQ